MWGVLLRLFHSGSCLVNMYFLSASDKPRKRVDPSGASVTSSVKWKAYNGHWASRCLPALKSWDSRFHWEKGKPHPAVATCQPHPWHGPGPAPFKPVHLGPHMGRVTQNPAITRWEVCVCVCVCDKYSHTSNTSPQLSLSPASSPLPSPWTTLFSEWGRSRCMSRWCDLKKVPTHPTKHLSHRPAWNPHHRHSVFCIQASCFQKFPVKGKRAQKCNMYSAFEFLFPSATVSSLTFTSSRHHSPDPPKHLTNRKTSPTRTEAWNPNL